jgi:putative Ca2+/H+ antiporter (TMEM165/GDT1 family)
VFYTFLVATILIALAELGDKTQQLALVLATRYKAWQVLVGILGATLLIHFFSTLAGGLIGSLMPQTLLTWVAGALFVGFGIWTLRGDRVDEGEATGSARFGPILTTAIAFFFAELGDKTQIMTMTISADPGAALRTFGGLAARWLPAGLAPTTGAAAFVGVWLGSTLGMMIADGVAILVGSVLGKRLPEQVITRVSGVVFIVFGVGLVAGAYLR